MGIDFNRVFITGRVYGMGLSPEKQWSLCCRRKTVCKQCYER